MSAEAVYEFEHPSPDRFSGGADAVLIGWVRCVAREKNPVFGDFTWDEQGVNVGDVFGVVDATAWRRYTMGDTPDKPTGMLRVYLGAGKGTWWLPAKCFVPSTVGPTGKQ